MELTDLTKTKADNVNLENKNKILVERANDFLESISNLQIIIDGLRKENSSLSEDKDVLTCKLNGLLNLENESAKLLQSNQSLINNNYELRTDLKHKNERLNKMEEQMQNILKSNSEQMDSNNNL